jgi:hypothetical protein
VLRVMRGMDPDFNRKGFGRGLSTYLSADHEVLKAWSGEAVNPVSHS